MQVTIRPVQPHDPPFLWDMLYEAVAVDPGMRSMGKEAVLTLPVNRKYLEGWGEQAMPVLFCIRRERTATGAA